MACAAFAPEPGLYTEPSLWLFHWQANILTAPCLQASCAKPCLVPGGLLSETCRSCLETNGCSEELGCLECIGQDISLAQACTQSDAWTWWQILVVTVISLMLLGAVLFSAWWFFSGRFRPLHTVRRDRIFQSMQPAGPLPVPLVPIDDFQSVPQTLSQTVEVKPNFRS